MFSKWRIAPISEITEKVAMGPFGSSIKVETFVPDGIPVISGQHLKGVKLEDSKFNFVSLKHAEKLKNANVQQGDVIFTHAGNIGQVAYIPKNSKYSRYIISQRQFYLRCDQSKILPEFIVYYFKSPEGQYKLLANRSQTGVPSIAQPVSYLRTIEIPVPPINEQREISEILCALDNKIEQNQKTNQTIETILQVIFKSWFKDFDPVHSKEEGKSPIGISKEVANYFPNSFQESEIGKIPKGWEIKALTEAIEVNPERKLKKGEIAPYLDMANMPTKSARVFEFYDREFGSGMRFINGDTLVARITPCLENGKTAFVDFLQSGKIGWGSTEYIVLRPKKPLPETFSYFLARSEEFRSFAISNMTGTTGRQRVPANCFDHFKIVVPSEKIANYFGELTKHSFALIKSNDEQTQTLINLRDVLLPKLLSGQINLEN